MKYNGFYDKETVSLARHRQLLEILPDSNSSQPLHSTRSYILSVDPLLLVILTSTICVYELLKQYPDACHLVRTLVVQVYIQRATHTKQVQHPH